MARQGRRLSIGGRGIGLSDDDSLAQTGARGEVKRYVGMSEAEIAAEAERIAKASQQQEEQIPIAIINDSVPESGGGGTADAGGVGTGGPSGGTEGSGAPGAGDSSTGGESGSGTSDSGAEGDGGAFKRGGKVGGKNSEHPITAQAGEWVINEAAVKKYGDKFMAALNAGKIPMMSSKAYAKGGKVNRGRYVRLAGRD